ncbi:porin [Palleronia sediminis]|nr:porin [Palleronia sediminis]
MKKLLIASTALVASTTFAMADVDLSGSAEMGVFGSDFDFDGVGGVIDEVLDQQGQFATDIDVIFSMSGQTDAGLTFGAEVAFEDDIAGGQATDDESDDGGAVVFVSGGFGTLTMGDTDGALDFVMQEAIIGGAIRDDHEHAGYNGNSLLDGFNGLDGQIARYEYTFGDFTVALSAELDDDDRANELLTGPFNGNQGPTYGIGGRYEGTFGATSFGVGLGYQVTDNDRGDDSEALGVSLGVQMDMGLQAILNYTDYDNVAKVFEAANGFPIGAAGIDNHWGIAVGYEFGAFLVAANYGKFDLDGGGDVDGYGLIGNYDLGGGAELQAGYGRSNFDNVGDQDTYSFGIAMSF